MATMFKFDRNFSMEPSDSFGTHLHALAIFFLYICIRCYRMLNDSPDIVESVNTETDFSKTNFNTSASQFLSKPKQCQSIISNDRAQNMKNSRTVTSTTTSDPDTIRDDHNEIAPETGYDSAFAVESTFSERRRFSVACKGDIIATRKRLNHYIQWNNKHCKAKIRNEITIKPTSDNDYDLWVESCLTAMKMSGEVENIVLPRVIRKICRKNEFSCLSRINKSDNCQSDCFDREGYRIFCARPALMDVKLAKASTYTLAIAIYLDRSCDREKMETITLCIDVRAGRGWPNTHVLRLMPFMKHAVTILLPLFPGRLQKALVYPVPRSFNYIWNIVSKYLDPFTVKRVYLLEGICKIEAPPPVEELKIHFGEEALEQLEACRINSFRLQ